MKLSPTARHTCLHKAFPGEKQKHKEAGGRVRGAGDRDPAKPDPNGPSLPPKHNLTVLFAFGVGVGFISHPPRLPRQQLHHRVMSVPTYEAGVSPASRYASYLRFTDRDSGRRGQG